MSRFYVHNAEGKWNIFSTISDEYTFDEFADFEDVCFYALGEKVAEAAEKLSSLKTNKPKLNTMSLEDVEKYLADMRGEE